MRRPDGHRLYTSLTDFEPTDHWEDAPRFIQNTAFMKYFFSFVCSMPNVPSAANFH